MRLSTLSFFLILSSVLALSSCKKEVNPENNVPDLNTAKAAKSDPDTKYNTFKGPQMQVGEGHARTFATISHSGVPKEIGVMFTENALDGLPATNTIYQLEFHHKAIEASLFEHVALGLSAAGHGLPPSGFIGRHFDFRFFMMTAAERLAIPAPPAPGFNVAPPPGYLPVNYALNAAVAQIGRHWGQNIFVAGQTVNHTMILGTWNGLLTFINPIVTLSTLAAGASYSVAYPQPQLFAEHGYYPTIYSIYKDEKGLHYVSLSGFIWR